MWQFDVYFLPTWNERQTQDQNEWSCIAYPNHFLKWCQYPNTWKSNTLELQSLTAVASNTSQLVHLQMSNSMWFTDLSTWFRYYKSHTLKALIMYQSSLWERDCTDHKTLIKNQDLFSSNHFTLLHISQSHVTLILHKLAQTGPNHQTQTGGYFLTSPS